MKMTDNARFAHSALHMLNSSFDALMRHVELEMRGSEEQRNGRSPVLDTLLADMTRFGEALHELMRKPTNIALLADWRRGPEADDATADVYSLLDRSVRVKVAGKTFHDDPPPAA